jgi:hypothetical protein
MHNHQNHQIPGAPDRPVTVLVANRAVLDRDAQRVAEHFGGDIERDTVLPDVAPVFAFVPFKAHSDTALTQSLA